MLSEVIRLTWLNMQDVLGRMLTFYCHYIKFIRCQKLISTTFHEAPRRFGGQSPIPKSLHSI
jgi:hypothetical protein